MINAGGTIIWPEYLTAIFLIIDQKWPLPDERRSFFSTACIMGALTFCMKSIPRQVLSRSHTGRFFSTLMAMLGVTYIGLF